MGKTALSSAHVKTVLFPLTSRCQDLCKKGTYGLKCSKKCVCQNNATCGHVNGTCNCTAGWTVSKYWGNSIRHFPLAKLFLIGSRETPAIRSVLVVLTATAVHRNAWIAWTGLLVITWLVSVNVGLVTMETGKSTSNAKGEKDEDTLTFKKDTDTNLVKMSK